MVLIKLIKNTENICTSGLLSESAFHEKNYKMDDLWNDSPFLRDNVTRNAGFGVFKSSIGSLIKLEPIKYSVAGDYFPEHTVTNKEYFIA